MHVFYIMIRYHNAHSKFKVLFHCNLYNVLRHELKSVYHTIYHIKFLVSSVLFQLLLVHH